MARTYAVANRPARSSRRERRGDISNKGAIARHKKPLAAMVASVALLGATVGGATAIAGGKVHVTPSTHSATAQGSVWNPPTNETKAPAVPTPGGAEPDVGSFNAVTCPTSSNCVAVGANAELYGIAATSTNGGSSWSAATVESGQPELNAVACSSTSDCVAVGVGDAATSSNDGSTWTSVSIPTSETTLLGVSCPTSSLCVSVGVSPVGGGPYNGQLLVSSNGGATWSAPSLPPHIGALGSVDCPSATFCVAVGAEILVSDDGGQTWSPNYVNGGTGVLRNVSCSSATECVAIGPNGQGAADPTAAAFAVSTTNAGATWMPETMPSGSYTLNAINCSVEGTCIATGPGANDQAPEAVSSDGGVSWAEVASFPSGLSAVADVSCRSTNSCVLVGLDGTTPVTGSYTGASAGATTGPNTRATTGHFGWSISPTLTINVTSQGTAR